MIEVAQRKLFGWLSQQFFEGSSKLARLLPQADPAKHNIEVIENIRYLPSDNEFHTLDIYRPRWLKGAAPIVFYIHGGGFRILSKDSHWIMALMFARQGYLVFNINYTLSTHGKFPHAIEDCIEALLFVLEKAGDYGGDIKRLCLAGESAGANLAVALSLAALSRQTKNKTAEKLYKVAPKIKAVLPACGLFQVSQPERFHHNIPFYAKPIVDSISNNYLPPTYGDPGSEPLADPLLFFESNAKITRKMPAYFSIVGGGDPIKEDTLRLHRALQKRTTSEMAEYKHRGHAFHAFVFDHLARQAWHDQFEFLQKYL